MNWKSDREFLIIHVSHPCILSGENPFFIHFRLKIDMYSYSSKCMIMKIYIRNAILLEIFVFQKLLVLS